MLTIFRGDLETLAFFKTLSVFSTDLGINIESDGDFLRLSAFPPSALGATDRFTTIVFSVINELLSTEAFIE